MLDLFSRKIVGWALDSHMHESLILEALNMAVSNRTIKHGTLIHSDRGVQYRGNEYQEALRMHGLRCSMSRKGNCWDTQSKLKLNVQPTLTRAGTGEAAFAFDLSV